MGRRSKSAKGTTKAKAGRILAALVGRRARRIMLGGIGSLLMIGLAAAVAFGTSRLEASIDGRLRERFVARMVLLDLPSELAISARHELQHRVVPLFDHPWTGPEQPRRIADALRESGWVEEVNFVRRTSDGQFKISCRYRTPTAIVQKGSEFFLVDHVGVPLPGKYENDPSWKLILGVAKPAPGPRAPWEGEDLRAGLAIIESLRSEPFAAQISAVSVENFGGRRNRWKSHIELHTDLPNGRIRWGSAPDHELEENTVAEKLAILRENYRQTGRIDANYPVIDVSTFPNQFTVPG